MLLPHIYKGVSSGLSVYGAEYPPRLSLCLRFAVYLAIPQRKTRGRADRYSFLVGTFILCFMPV